MNRARILILAAVVIALGSTAVLNVTNANEPDSGNVKTVAWYVANIKEARAQNQTCHDNPNLQGSENCVNALHALEITFKGGN